MSGTVEKMTTVVQHAVEQYRNRRPDTDLTDPEIRNWIREQVREGLSEGRFADRKPKPFRLYREPRKGLMFHELDRCVWNEEQTLAWIVRRFEAEDVVMTTLTRART